MMASAMHDVLATRESLSSLTKGTHMTVAHAECEIELVGKHSADRHYSTSRLLMLY